MCNLGEILELEAIKSERVRNIKSIMTKLKMSFKEAIAFLEIPEDDPFRQIQPELRSPLMI